jgi:hypothetical protein
MPYQTREDMQVSDHVLGDESQMFWASRSGGSVTLCSSTGGLYVNQVEKQSVRDPLVTCPAASNHHSDPRCLRAPYSEVLAASPLYCHVMKVIRRVSWYDVVRSSLSICEMPRGRSAGSGSFAWQRLCKQLGQRPETTGTEMLRGAGERHRLSTSA